MQFSIIAGVASLVTLASAQFPPANYSWSVTGWSAGCARSCYYDFNITGIDSRSNDLPIPAFKAYCSGYDSRPFALCKLLDDEEGAEPDGRFVAAQLQPLNTSNPGAHIAVSYQFDGLTEGSFFNYTGRATSIFNQFSAPLQNFTIKPTEAWGVA